MIGLALFAMLASGAQCGDEAPTGSSASESASASSAQAPPATDDALDAVASDPEAFVGETVTLRGTLSNAGENYFKDLEVVLTSESGAFLHVQPWLPISVPPPPPGGEKRQTLSSFLGKHVELTGIVTLDSLKNVGRTHFLEVESARILDDERK